MAGRELIMAKRELSMAESELFLWQGVSNDLWQGMRYDYGKAGATIMAGRLVTRQCGENEMAAVITAVR